MSASTTSTVSASAPRFRPGLTVSVLGFVLLMLAAGHLLMVAINALEPAPQSAGSAALYFGDAPLVDTLERAARHAGRHPERAETLQTAATRVAAGGAHGAHTLPVSPFVVWTALGLVVFGVVLLWWSARLKSDTAQTLVGIVAGNSLWTGGVEYGLIIASRHLGIAKSFTAQSGELIGIFGEYVLLKHTWGLLGIVMVYLAFQESVRCPMFVALRGPLGMMRGPLTRGRVDNYGPRVAFQYVTTVWAFYLLLLWAYDGALLGAHGPFTHAVFFGSLAASVYLVTKLLRITKAGPALRMAIGTAMVLWNTVEIAAKWNLFAEPWLVLSPMTALVFFGGATFGAVLVWRTHKTSAKRTPSPPRLTPANGARA